MHAHKCQPKKNEAALIAELDNQLSYNKHNVTDSSHSRNGYTSTTIQKKTINFKIHTPRNRNDDFES